MAVSKKKRDKDKKENLRGPYDKAQQGIVAGKKAILHWLSRANTFSGACSRAGVSYSQGYAWRRADPIFDQDCIDAHNIGTEQLEEIAISRGKRKSDVLLMFVMKSRDPKYKDKQEVNVTPVEVTIKKF